MTRVLLLMIIIAAGWLGYRYWQGEQKPPEILPKEIWKLSGEVLKPLDEGPVISDAAANGRLVELTDKVALRRGQPDYAGSAQALKILAQALAERRELINRARAGSERTALDEVSGVWRRVDDTNIIVDRPKESHMARASFWAGAQIARWRERCVYYRRAVADVLPSWEGGGGK